MKPAKSTCVGIAIFLGTLASPVRLTAQSSSSGLVTFDVPGAEAAPGSNDGTFPESINTSGVVTGRFGGTDRVIHGFVLSADGQFTVFDAPGASAIPGSGEGTLPESIDAAGVVTGHYTDAHTVRHGFVRSRTGRILTFDAPGAGAAPGSGWGTFPESINAGREITGHYIDASNATHGFVRNRGGEITSFDAPGASISVGGTFPTSINDAGTIAGHYADEKAVNHGFLRSPGGRFVTFDATAVDLTPGSNDGTFPRSINAAGAVTGYYDGADRVIHGFVRSPEGEFITFDAPGAGVAPGSGWGTFPESINGAGAVTGHYLDAHDVSHGFLRAPDGELTTFDAPGASRSLGGTSPRSINDAGTIAGHYADGRVVDHGFIGSP